MALSMACGILHTPRLSSIFLSKSPLSIVVSSQARLLLSQRQISTDAENVASRLISSVFMRTQGLIGGKWTNAYDGKTIQVSKK